ncbi:YkvI family membrane protein [Alkaliphilus peptidifermentans]|uniref:Uncharacterized membrane protein YkvI n=1 Tax=Alkaliphilus peptidifermentans DSM 18978 TaxID=1120976 RepID=A0A1G5HFL7_9FIRM|nr:hypothetical protein [Alkaliphilus peptidifermentans]SCY62563.1 Uncharacterized membrane protein YkvI [Alkaliphilus peptidifermentans DSM 18978]
MQRIKSIWTLASIYVGTVIGAGFASGQEILHFFGRYGVYGGVGVVLATILFTIIGIMVLTKVYNRNILKFDMFTLQYLSPRYLKIVQLVFILFLIASYLIMITGSGAILKEHFQLNPFKGIIIMTIICYIVFIFGTKGIARTNEILVPIMTAIVIVVAIVAIINQSSFISNGEFKLKVIIEEVISGFRKSNFTDIIVLLVGAMWSSIIYVSYNILISVAVMSSVRPLIYDKGSAIGGGLVGGLILGVLAMLILSSLLIFWPNIYKLEVPMVAIAYSLGGFSKNIYSILLLLAMFTTAIAAGHGGISNICEMTGASVPMIGAFVCIITIPLTLLGFKGLISIIYPFFGYLGFGFLALILLNPKG